MVVRRSLAISKSNEWMVIFSVPARRQSSSVRDGGGRQGLPHLTKHQRVGADLLVSSISGRGRFWSSHEGTLYGVKILKYPFKRYIFYTIDNRYKRVILGPTSDARWSTRCSCLGWATAPARWWAFVSAAECSRWGAWRPKWWNSSTGSTPASSAAIPGRVSWNVLDLDIET